MVKCSWCGEETDKPTTIDDGLREPKKLCEKCFAKFKKRYEGTIWAFRQSVGV